MELPGTVSAGPSSDLHQAAAPLPQLQTVYYAAGALLQPVRFVVQAQLQEVVLLADQATRATEPGLYVVQASQNPPPPPPPPSGFLIHGGQQLQRRAAPVVVAAAAAPTSVSLQGWRMAVPNPGGKAAFVGPPAAHKGGAGVAERDPGPAATREERWGPPGPPRRTSPE